MRVLFILFFIANALTASSQSRPYGAPRVFNVRDYGAVPDDGIDDYGAIMTTFTACNDLGGGEVWFPSGKFITSRVLKLPLNSFDNTDLLRSISLMGEVMPNMVSEPLSSKPQPQFGSIIEGTFLGDSAVIATNSSVGTWGDFNFLNIWVENIAIRVRSKTAGVDVSASGQGIDARKMAFIQIRNVSISITSNIANAVQPASTSAGVIFSGINNFVMVNANNLFVTGLYYGAFLQEHASIDNYFADACVYGAYFGTSNHDSYIDKGVIARCKYNIGGASGSYFKVTNVSFEDNLTSGTWWENVLDLEASSLAVGYINYHRVVTGGIDNDNFRRSNVPYNVTCLPLGENVPKWATANRPTLIPTVGTIMGYNTDSNFVEVRNSGSATWIKISGVTNPTTYYDHDYGVSLETYYAFEQSSGDFTDASGNSKDVSRNNSVATIVGKVGNAAGFTGASSQYLKTSSGVGLSAGTGFTFLGWVKLYNTADAYMVITQKGRGGSFNFEYNVFQNAGNCYFSLSTDGTSAGIVSVNRPLLRDSLWHFIDARWNGATMSLKIDNGVAATSNIATVYSGSAVLYFGSESVVPTNYLTGGIDEAGVWNTWQTDAFVTSVFATGNGRTIGQSPGAALFTGSDGLPFHDLNFHWDNTNKRLGLATNTPTSTLQVAGTVGYKIDSTATSITLGNHNILQITATGQTITLPDVTTCSGRTYTIKLTASGSATISTTSSQLIDGSTTYSLASQYKYVTVQSNGLRWIVISNN